VTQTRRPSGRSTSMFFRLCSAAPRISQLDPPALSPVREGAHCPVSPRRPRAPRRRPGEGASAGALAPGEVLRRQRLRRAQRSRRAEEHDLAAALAGAGAHVEDAVGLEHDLRVVLDHHQRVAGVAQAAHDADDAAHVARVQADGGLVEHEQRVDQRGAERRGEVDALHLAAGERARLAVEREVAEADLAQVREPRADLGEQQVGGLVQRGRAGRARRRSRAQRSIGSSIRSCRESGFARGRLAEPPQQRLGLQARAVAGRQGV
jgi:hypothetical protein